MSIGQGIAAFLAAGTMALAMSVTGPSADKPAGWSADTAARNWLTYRDASIATLQAAPGLVGTIDPSSALPTGYIPLYGWSTVSQAVPGGRLAVTMISPAGYGGPITELAAQAARISEGDHGIGIARQAGQTIIGQTGLSNVPTPAGILPGTLVAITFLRDPS
jgi:hypothetical protein